MRKVVYVGYDLSIKGGVQTVILLYQKYFSDTYFHPSIKASRYRFWYIGYSILAYFKFLWVVRRHRSEVAHILIASPFDQLRNIPYIIMARAAGLKVLLQFHYRIGPDFQRLPAILRQLVKFSYQRAHLLSFVTESMQRDFIDNIGPSKSVVIPNPISPEYLSQEILPLKERGQDIIFLGRMTKEKGVDDLIEVAKIHYQHDPGVTYHFCGDGIYPKDFPPNCRFHGWVEGNKKLEMLKRAKVLVLPSYNEAFGMVLIEGMSCGTPVVATRVGGIPDLITDQAQGVLVSAGDIKGLYEGIVKLVYNAPFWMACSGKCTETVLRYDLGKIASVWERVYDDLVDRVDIR